MKYKAVIIDDEESAIRVLESMILEDCPELKVVGSAGSVADGLKEIGRSKPDVVFLDIAMPKGNGFQLLELTEKQNFKVVFVTAYDAYAIKAFEYAALHYLLKPVDTAALREAVVRLRENHIVGRVSKKQMRALLENNRDGFNKLALPTRTGFAFVEIDDIVRCEACENYTRFFLRNGTSLLVSKPMHKYEDLLRDRQFFRVHRKYLINLRCIEAYSKGKSGFIEMHDGSKVEVSYRRKDELLAELQKLMRF